jgi:starch synthase
VRLLLPAYRDSLKRVKGLKRVARFSLPGFPFTVGLFACRLPGSQVKVWLVDFPPLYDRPGNPYHDAYGNAWPDNAERFALLNRVACAIALDQLSLKWKPDVVHGHDWHAGLVTALLAPHPTRPATVFTVHNLAHQGNFSREYLYRLNLPKELWSIDGLEFYGQLSFMKAGLQFADRLTTVSPNYAREIQTPRFGHGFDGLLRHRAKSLSGILNGIDDQDWDPRHDRYLETRYSPKAFDKKIKNKLALQQAARLNVDPDIPLMGTVGRLVQQKGTDLILEALPTLMSHPAQIVLLGTGEPRFEKAWNEATRRYPGKLAVRIDYDEPSAHRIEAGADLFLMPSRFEPCGLNQLYSLRYGTVPVVHGVGGLADTVVDATEKNRKKKTATGFVFQEESASALLQAVERALTLYENKKSWRALAETGMRQDFSWDHSALAYLALYRGLLKKGRSDPTSPALRATPP